MRKPCEKNINRLREAAMGKIPCDLSIENSKFLNVFSGEIYPASVDILDGFVIRIREGDEKAPLPSAEVYDAGGKYLAPGFIDTHMHVESTMMIPEQFGRAVIPWGTTTVCTDPHEIGNVQGIEGVRFMLESGRRSVLRHYVLAPSCVPAVQALENSGAVFSAKEVAQMLEMDDVVGVAEIMDFIGVINGSDRMDSIIAEGRKRGVFLQGHMPGLSGGELSAYRIGGPESDHEMFDAGDIRKKIRAGFHVNIRSSSLTDHITELVKGIKDMPSKEMVSVCTDDVHAGDLLKKGHVNWVVKRMIECGIMPGDAYRCATINAAREYHFEDLGALAPGYIADCQLLRELDGGRPEAVFAMGKLVALNGKYLPGTDGSAPSLPLRVELAGLGSPDDLRIAVPGQSSGTVKVRCMKRIAENSPYHTDEWVSLPVKDGFVSLGDAKRDFQFIAVVNRYGKQAKTVALIKGFGLKEGAYASTISHDSHNLIIVYTSAEDAWAAAKELERTGGGITLIKQGKPIGTLALPVGGLMSTLPCGELAAEIEKMAAVVREHCRDDTKLLATAILSLSVLPAIVITDKGLVDGRTQTFLEILKKD